VTVDVNVLLRARSWPSSLKEALEQKEALRHSSPSSGR
jgi:hypothetical protein